MMVCQLCSIHSIVQDNRADAAAKMMNMDGIEDCQKIKKQFPPIEAEEFILIKVPFFNCNVISRVLAHDNGL